MFFLSGQFSAPIVLGERVRVCTKVSSANGPVKKFKVGYKVGPYQLQMEL